MDDMVKLCRNLDSVDKVELLRALVEIKRSEKSSLEFCCSTKSFVNFLNIVGEKEQQLENDLLFLISSYLRLGNYLLSSNGFLSNHESFVMYSAINKYGIKLHDSPESTLVTLRQVVSNFPLLVATILSGKSGNIACICGNLNGLPACLAFPWGINIIPTTPHWEPMIILWKMWKESYPDSVTNKYSRAQYMTINYFYSESVDRVALMNEFEVCPPTRNAVVHKINSVLRQYGYGDSYTAFEIIFASHALDIWNFYGKYSKTDIDNSPHRVRLNAKSYASKSANSTTSPVSLSRDHVFKVRSDSVTSTTSRCLFPGHDAVKDQHSDTSGKQEPPRPMTTVSFEFSNIHELKDLVDSWKQSNKSRVPSLEKTAEQNAVLGGTGDLDNFASEGFNSEAYSLRRDLPEGTSVRKMVVDVHPRNDDESKCPEKRKQKEGPYQKYGPMNTFSILSRSNNETSRGNILSTGCVGAMKSDCQDAPSKSEVASLEYRALREAAMMKGSIDTVARRNVERSDSIHQLKSPCSLKDSELIPKAKKKGAAKLYCTTSPGSGHLMKNETTSGDDVISKFKADIMSNIVREYFYAHPLPGNLCNDFSSKSFEFPELDLISHVQRETKRELDKNRSNTSNSPQRGLLPHPQLEMKYERDKNQSNSSKSPKPDLIAHLQEETKCERDKNQSNALNSASKPQLNDEVSQVRTGEESGKANMYTSRQITVKPKLYANSCRTGTPVKDDAEIPAEKNELEETRAFVNRGLAEEASATKDSKGREVPDKIPALEWSNGKAVFTEERPNPGHQLFGEVSKTTHPTSQNGCSGQKECHNVNNPTYDTKRNSVGEDKRKSDSHHEAVDTICKIFDIDTNEFWSEVAANAFDGKTSGTNTKERSVPDTFSLLPDVGGADDIPGASVARVPVRKYNTTNESGRSRLAEYSNLSAKVFPRSVKRLNDSDLAKDFDPQIGNFPFGSPWSETSNSRDERKCLSPSDRQLHRAIQMFLPLPAAALPSANVNRSQQVLNVMKARTANKELI